MMVQTLSAFFKKLFFNLTIAIKKKNKKINNSFDYLSTTNMEEGISLY